MIVDPSDLLWGQLSDNARADVLDLVRLLAEGFTGTIELYCNNGGIVNFWETRNRLRGTRKTRRK